MEHVFYSLQQKLPAISPPSPPFFFSQPSLRTVILSLFRMACGCGRGRIVVGRAGGRHLRASKMSSLAAQVPAQPPHAASDENSAIGAAGDPSRTWWALARPGKQPSDLRLLPTPLRHWRFPLPCSTPRLHHGYGLSLP